MEIPAENPFSKPAPPLPARGGGKGARPGSRRGSSKGPDPSAPPDSSSSSTFSSSFQPPPPSDEAYETRGATGVPEDVGGGGGTPSNYPSTTAASVVKSKRSLCSSLLGSCGRCSRAIASTKAGTGTFLFITAVTSLALFALSCNILDTSSPFTQHMINWRIPLSFFSSLLAATSVGNVLLIQLRSLVLMSASLVVCGGLFFYCLIIDGPAAQKRTEYCATLSASVNAASPICRVTPYNAVVVLDFVLIPLLIFGGVIAWLHRRQIRAKYPASSAAPVVRGGARAGGPGTGGDGESQEGPEVNVFK